MSLLIFLRRLEMLRELERVVSELVTVMYITLHSEDESFIPTTSLPDRQWSSLGFFFQACHPGQAGFFVGPV